MPKNKVNNGFYIGPQAVFLLIWLVPLSLPYIFQDNPLLLPISFATQFLVASNIFYFLIFAFLFGRFIFSSRGYDAVDAISRINFSKFYSNSILAFKIWIIIYIINIIGSGGVPILWVLIGDHRTYADFGLPTLGGIGNLIRAIIVTSSYMIVFHSNLKRQNKIKSAVVALLLLMSAFVIENARGNAIVLLLHPIGMHLLLTKLRVRDLVKWILISLFFIFTMGLMQILRYADGGDMLEKYASASGFADVGYIQMLFTPALMYIGVPIVNADLNVSVAPFFQFEPYYSLQGLIPSVIRNFFFERVDYGELINEANNVSSFYVSFIRDFGYFGAYMVSSIILVLVAFIYAKARRGNIYYIMSYPPIFMSVTLSFFSLFFTSLVVLLYPVFSYLLLRGCLNKLK